MVKKLFIKEMNIFSMKNFRENLKRRIREGSKEGILWKEKQ